jgi:hypothetical protein
LSDAGGWLDPAKGKRHLKHFRHLEWVWSQFERWPNQCHHRRDTKAGASSIFRQKANNFDALPIQSDFFLGLTEGSEMAKYPPFQPGHREN